MKSSPTDTDVPTATLTTPTETFTVIPTRMETVPVITTPTETLLPMWVSQEGDGTSIQIVKNSTFDYGISSWERRQGKLSHTKTEYISPPGAARLISSHSDGLGSYTSIFGQCINLDSVLPEWLEVNGHRLITLVAYLKITESMTSATMGPTFTDVAGCIGEHVGYASPTQVAANQDWTLVNVTLPIPEGATSFDIVIFASGSDDKAMLYLDDVVAYAPDVVSLP